ncbi:restriction endonuclease subunit S [Arthrobacter oryzae]|uniref:restriction endonuclease subunit S n=1 Tax=Arthrobacter oryzae TaxID=409290 RepID=UPI002864C315|nr:restriction endonuclease subunit S [Arthrobacter oryzae]MDR6507283.1 type I restriction enzyme S subunit [Arthrobacter oryzae]
MTEAPYESYKTTTLPWLEALPVDWSESRLGYETWVRARLGWKGLKADEYVDSGFAFLSTPNIKRRDIDFERVNFITRERYDESPEIKLTTDDVLLAKDGSTLGTVNVVRELPVPATVNSSIAVLTPGPRCQGRYVHYLIQSELIQSRIEMLKGGMGVPHLFQDDIRRMPIPFPPYEVQARIVDYLDRETAKIDELIGKKERLIELLAEKRQAIITHAVTKGLDPTAPNKPSGVPWQGSVPEHWSVQPLKNMMRMQTGVTLGKDFAQDVTETYAYLRVANVQIGYVDLTDVKEIDLPPQVAASSMLQPGDVLMTEGGDRDKLARGCIWDGSISPCVHQNHIFAVRTRPQLNSKFLVLVLDADPARTYFYLTGKQSTNLASTNSTTVKNFRFGLPPITEQHRIVEYLSVKTRQIDDLADKARAVVSILRERRSALISAAVTGKMNVTSEGVPA